MIFPNSDLDIGSPAKRFSEFGAAKVRHSAGE